MATEAEFQKAVEALRRGLPVLAAAQEAGISERCLTIRLHRAGGRVALGIPPAPKWTQQQERGPLDMARLLLAGASQGSIGLQWGVGDNVMKSRISWMRANGYLPKGFLAFNSRCLSDPRHDAAIATAAAAGEAPEQVAARLFVPLRFVQYRLNRLAEKLPEEPSAVRHVTARRPKGWLMTEQHMAALFARAGQTYGSAQNCIRG